MASSMMGLDAYFQIDDLKNIKWFILKHQLLYQVCGMNLPFEEKFLTKRSHIHSLPALNPNFLLLFLLSFS